MEVGDDDNLEEINGIERAAQNANIISLQKDLIDQITDSNVTKIWRAPSKRRLKSVLELSKRRIPMREVTEINDNQTTRVQRKCLLCGQSGHYQKKCPIGRR